ncbi:MAG: glycosyltransferase [Verrucomicrobiae bacterium]|nr:glycosyltransferase [Verrucomicrobiae bacterium]
MRIALLTHEPFHPPSGGGSAAAVYLVRQLVARGHEVEVFGPALPDAPDVEARFHIRLRPFTAWPMGRTTPLRTPKYLAYPVALSRQIARLLASGLHFDVVVAQHAISAVAAGRLGRRFQIPTVFNLLDCLTGFLETWPACLMPRPLARALVRYELHLPVRFQASRVLTVSDSLRERLIATGYPADRVRATYYGYDSTLFRVPAQPCPSPPEPRVVMHGSFDRHHLGPIARTAVIETARARPHVPFRFVGPATPSLNAFLRTVRAAVPGILIEQPGFVPYDRMPSSLLDATVGITPYEPSTGTHCAFVAKTVEYLALGLPVVCTPLESALRYYKGLDGIRFSRANGPDFARLLIDTLDWSSTRRAAAVAPARHKVATELDWNIICRRAADWIEGAALPAHSPQVP